MLRLCWMAWFHAHMKADWSILERFPAIMAAVNAFERCHTRWPLCLHFSSWIIFTVWFLLKMSEARGGWVEWSENMVAVRACFTKQVWQTDLSVLAWQFHKMDLVAWEKTGLRVEVIPYKLPVNLLPLATCRSPPLGWVVSPICWLFTYCWFCRRKMPHWQVIP